MRFIFLLAFVFLLKGCTAFPGMTQLQGAVVIGTDKTIEDHVMSFTSGKNCSLIRKEKGLTYCEEDEPKIMQNIFCYKTLGSVTCYDRPDSNVSRNRIDRNDHNSVN
ncbi:MAG: hypothetical protein VX923_01515 [Pseudomonadota bacterium]|nr:hypothetical protein [Pseudomonadota bacterium]